MKPTYYAKPKKSFDNFRKGNLYQIVSKNETTGRMIVINKGKEYEVLCYDFTFEPCIFNEPKQIEK